MANVFLWDHVIHAPLSAASDLAALDVTDYINGVVANVINLGIFVYNNSATATPDNITVVQPITGPGRWLISTPNISVANAVLGSLGTPGSLSEIPFTSLARQLSAETSTSAYRTALTAAASGANSDITSILGLTTPLSGAMGGTGIANTGATLTISGAASVSGSNTGDQTSITGNAATATALQTARTINGVSFNGTANITVPSAAGTLTGATLASNVVSSSLTGLGTITTGIWNGTVLATTYGGTGNTTGLASSVAAANITGGTLASNVVASSLTSLGTITTLNAVTETLGSNTIAGTLNIYPSGNALGYLNLSVANNSGNFITSITNAAQAGAHTYTIPDAGVSTNFVMGAGTQTLAGTYTFSNTIVGNISGTSGTASAVAASALTGTTLASNVIASSLTSFGSSPSLTSPSLSSPTLTGTITTSGLTASSAVVTNGSSQLASLAYTSGPTASTLASRDASSNVAFNQVFCGIPGTSQGALTIYTPSASLGNTIFTASNNAGNTQTTINTASQAGARAYTIPDAGVSTNFVMGAGTQTLAGTYTFSNTIVGNISGTSGTASAVAASALTGTTLASNVIASSLTSFGSSPSLTSPSLSSPTLTGTITTSGLTASSAVVTNGSSQLASLAYSSSATASTLASRDSSGTCSFNTVFLGTPGSAGGALAINPTSSGFGYTLFYASNNTGNTVTSVLTAPQAGARNYTIPDAGTNASFVMTQGAQTIAGATTFSTPIAVGSGGTGDASFTAYSVICGGTTSTGALQSIASVGASGQVLTSNGTSALPTWQAGIGTALQIVNTQTFTSSGTYTPTSGMLYCIIEAVGGGGGGVTTGASNISSGSGGGSYTKGLFTAAQIGSSQTVTIGTGGTAGNAGVATSVSTLVVTTGGGIGVSITVASTPGGSGGAAGSVAGGKLIMAIPGGDGGPGQFTTNGQGSGFGGASFYGLSCKGAASGSAGNAGKSYGGGASGTQNGTAASGAPGIVIITEYCS
jgi:hypothetical protein